MQAELCIRLLEASNPSFSALPFQLTSYTYIATVAYNAGPTIYI